MFVHTHLRYGLTWIILVPTHSRSHASEAAGGIFIYLNFNGIISFYCILGDALVGYKFYFYSLAKLTAFGSKVEASPTMPTWLL